MQTLYSGDVTRYTGRPRFEGANIRNFIGFKHFMYLVEEAVLQHFRERGYTLTYLLQDLGLCLEIVDSGIRIGQAVFFDDEVRVEVKPEKQQPANELALAVQMFSQRNGEEIRHLTGKVRVLLRRDSSPLSTDPPPETLAPYVHPSIQRDREKGRSPVSLTDTRGAGQPDEAVLAQLAPAGSNSFVWKWRIPYFYCHYSERLQHSGYVRIMEEVVDLFLADRGISIKTMLDSRRWIPFVSEARVELLRDAFMEETIYTVLQVEDVFKDVTFSARMDCYVQRGNGLVHTATGQIVHGYAIILNRQDWELAHLDAHTVRALRGEAR